MDSRYRADHVGSLLRPEELLAARERYENGDLPAEELREREDEAILRALEMQKASGIGVLSDGEYRRATWMDAWARVLDGFVRTEAAPTPMVSWKGPTGHLVAPVPGQPTGRRVIERRIELDEVPRLTAREVPFLKQHAGEHPFKITMPGAGQFMTPEVFEPGITDRVYDDRRQIGLDLAGVSRREVLALIDEGVPYIQLDSLRYVIQLADPARRQLLVDRGIDPEQELDAMITVDNAVIEGVDRKGSVIGLHMCRGNNRSAWAAEGSYETVAEKAFSQLQYDRFLLEYDDEERQGGFEAIRFVPPDKVVVLGIVSSKLATLEDADALRRRIDEAAKYHPLDTLAISPQCGFASSSAGNLLSWDEQERKLELLADVAEKVWG